MWLHSAQFLLQMVKRDLLRTMQLRDCCAKIRQQVKSILHVDLHVLDKVIVE